MMRCRRPFRSSFGAVAACLAVAALAGCGTSETDGDHIGNALMSAGPPNEGGGAGTSGSVVTVSPGAPSAPQNTVSPGGTVSPDVPVPPSVTSPSDSSPSTPVGNGGSGPGGVTGRGGTQGEAGSAGASGPTGTGGLGGVGGQTGTSGSAGTAAVAGNGGEGPVSAGGSAGMAGATGSGGSGGAGEPPNTCPPETPLTGGMQYCSNTKGNVGNGYGYELWADGGGSGCMTVRGVDATFGATWSDVEDFLGRVGLDFDQTRTHSQIGTITAEFAETKTDDGGLTYIGIYGWTVNPLREFYILDDWGSEKPGGFSSDGTPRDEVGTLMADGEIYDVWKKTRENKPAITGDSETFDQYFSIRRTARQCGTISISEHFAQWEELGLPLGNLHEVKLLVESQFNSGSIEFTTATVVVE